MTPHLGTAALALVFFALPVHAQNAAAFPVETTTPPDADAVAAVPASSVIATPSVSEPSQPRTLAPEQRPTPAPPRALPSEAPRESTRWYGWQTLLTDGAALTFLFAVATADRASTEEAFVAASVGTYLLGGPIVHAGHGNWGRAVGSLGLRVGAPMLGAGVGSALEDCSGGDFCGLAGAVFGGAVGLLAAVTIDSAAIARDPVRETAPIVPVVRTGKNGTWVGVSGRF